MVRTARIKYALATADLGERCSTKEEIVFDYNSLGRGAADIKLYRVLRRVSGSRKEAQRRLRTI